MIVMIPVLGENMKRKRTRLNCSSARLLRNVSVTLAITVPGMEVLSSAAISVNITPSTQSFAYQPVTSVSRVEAERTEEILFRILPFFSDGRSPISSSKSMNGFRERSLRFLSRAIIRRKASGFRTTRSSLDAASESALTVTPFIPERRACTISSA